MSSSNIQLFSIVYRFIIIRYSTYAGVSNSPGNYYSVSDMALHIISHSTIIIYIYMD